MDKDEEINDVEDMRSDFEDAIKTVEDDDDPAEEETGGSQEEPTAETAPETPPEPDGEEDQPAPAEEPDNDSPAPSRAEKAPAGWTPAEREQWAGLPTDIKARITKREKEIADGLNNQVENRKLGQQYSEIAGKYQATFAAEGFASDPAKAVEGLVQGVTNMRFGTKEQKVKHIADFIKTYDVDISMLDDSLAGASPSPEQTQDTRIEQMLDKRMAPVNNLLQQLEQNKTASAEALNIKTSQDVATFSESAEFISDVRMDMADLMDLAAQRGQEMSLQDAYDKACAINPEISKVLTSRAEKERILGNNNDVTAKLAAASSIAGDQGGTGGGAGDLSLRDEIASQWGTG